MPRRLLLKHSPPLALIRRTWRMRASPRDATRNCDRPRRDADGHYPGHWDDLYGVMPRQGNARQAGAASGCRTLPRV
jgi:hypothetical protein